MSHAVAVETSPLALVRRDPEPEYRSNFEPKELIEHLGTLVERSRAFADALKKDTIYGVSALRDIGNTVAQLESLRKQVVEITTSSEPQISDTRIFQDLVSSAQTLGWKLQKLEVDVAAHVQWWKRKSSKKKKLQEQNEEIRVEITIVVNKIFTVVVENRPSYAPPCKQRPSLLLPELLSLPEFRPRSPSSTPRSLSLDQYYPVSSFVIKRPLPEPSKTTFSPNPRFRKLFEQYMTIDQHYRHDNYCNQSLPGTCTWLVEDLTDRKWFASASPQHEEDCKIWLLGRPGVGKSVLAAAVVEELRKRNRSHAFYYMSHANTQTVSEMSMSILLQVCQQIEQKIDPLCRVLEIPQSRRPSLDFIGRTFSQIRKFHDTDLVIDGWDLQQTIPKYQIDEFRDLMRLLLENFQKVIFTSRTKPDQDFSQEFKIINMQHNFSDLKAFVDAAFEGGKQTSVVPEFVHKDLVPRILSDAHGIFLRAAVRVDIVLNALSVGLSSRDIMQLLIDAVDDSPSGGISIRHATFAALERQPDHLRQIAVTAMTWLAESKGTISLAGLCEGLLIRTSHSRHQDVFEILPKLSGNKKISGTNWELLPFMKPLVLCCCQGLIKIDPSTSSVAFQHLELQEVAQDWLRSEVPKSTDIASLAEVSVRYLQLSEFRAGPCATEQELQKRLHTYRFLDYAASSWVQHVRTSTDDEISTLAFQLLRSPQSHAQAVQICLYQHYVNSGSDLDWDALMVRSTTTTPLQTAVFYGLKKLVHLLIEAKEDVNKSDEMTGLSPLHLAVRDDRFEIAEALLEAGASLRSLNKDRNTPLHFAQIYNRPKMFAVLVSRLYPASTVNVASSICAPVFEGFERPTALVEFYMLHCVDSQKGIPSAAKIMENYTEAIKNQLIGPLMILLDARNSQQVTANTTAEDGTPVIHLAIRHAQHRGSVLRLLLAHGADACILNASRNLESAVQCAVRHGDIDCVEILLSSKALVNHIDREQNTALHMAVRAGRADILQLLLQFGADPNLDPGTGKTPLMLARTNPARPELVTFLKGAALFDKQLKHYHATSLFHAVRATDETLTFRLIQEGADVDQRDSVGRTVLFEAVRQNSLPITYLLLCNGVDIRAQDLRGRNVLHEAAFYAGSKVLDLLASRLHRFLGNSNLHTQKDSLNRTPSDYASIAGEAAALNFDAFLEQMSDDDWIIGHK